MSTGSAHSANGGALCRLVGNEWIVTGDPFILTRMEAVFPLSRRSRESHAIAIPAGPEQCRDLLWFRTRYPITIEGKGEWTMRSLAAKYTLRQQQAESILSGSYEPKPVQFARGQSPRDYQQTAADLWKSVQGLLLADDVGLGKAQPLDCMVMTTSGWKRMGDIKVGDEVVDPDGGTGFVTGVYDRDVREVYKVTTSDGRSTKCCDEHLWQVQTANDRKRKSSRVVPLSEIRKQLFRSSSGQRMARWFLPICKPYAGIRLPETQPSLELVKPYMLGALLGDGTIRPDQLSFSCYDASVRERFASLLPEYVRLRKVGAEVHDYQLSVGRQGDAPFNPLLSECKAVGIAGMKSWEKRVPMCVFGMCQDDRLEVLRGLMDTDGTIGKSGSPVTFTTTSPGLADDVRRLVESLGGFASVSSRITNYTYKGVKKQGRRSYTLVIRIDVCPFHCEKKKARFRSPYMARSIVAVDHCGQEAVRCIAVSTKRNLYVTDGHIVTHNTVVGITAFMDPVLRPALVVVPVHLCIQWQGQIKRFAPALKTHVIQSTLPYSLNIIADCPSCGAVIDTKNETRDLTPTCPVCKRRFPNNVPKRPPDVTIISYSKLMRWPDHINKACRSVVFDEAHALRGSKTERGKAAKRICRALPYRMLMTATPLFNLGGEAFNIIDCVSPGFLGDRDTFQANWCKYQATSREPPLVDPSAFGSYLKSSKVMLRRTALDVGIPVHDCEIIHQTVDSDTEIFEDASSKAEELAKMILSDVTKRRGEVSMELDSVIRQATGLSKVPAVVAFCEMLLEQDESIVVFAWHRACFARGTKAIRFDGTFCNVEDIKVGDELLGPDGNKRLVRATNRGHGRMFRVIPNRGEPWVCSEHHTLFVHDNRVKGNKISRLTVNEYLQLGKSTQGRLTLVKSKRQVFNQDSKLVEPWLLGYWLGDGDSSLRELRVTSADQEVADELVLIASRHGQKVKRYNSSQSSRLGKPENRKACFIYAINGGGGKGSRKPQVLARHFRKYGLHNNKHIPDEYKTASVESRLELLAGLIDSDGHALRSKNTAGCMEFTNTNKRLCDDVAYVARSLGFSAVVSAEVRRRSKGVFRVYICGALEEIPTRIARKKSPVRKGQKNVRHVGFRVEEVESDDFFGFELDGDRLFLMDDFTIAHNCHDLLQEKLAAWNPVMYTGTETAMQKAASVHRFQTKDSKVIIVSLRAGEGLDGLQFASCTAVVAELDWTWSVAKQNVGRIARDGQTRPCRAYFLTSEYGSDPIVSQVLGLKKDQLNGLLGERPNGPVRAFDSATAIRELATKYLQRRRQG